MQAGKVLRDIQALTANLYKPYGRFRYTKAISFFSTGRYEARLVFEKLYLNSGTY